MEGAQMSVSLGIPKVNGGRETQLRFLLLTALTLFLAGPSGAEEGFWTFNNFPAGKVQESYGFLPTSEWLDHVRLSSLRTPGSCSASFVSDQGLVLTNHHCVVECLAQLSTAAKDYLASPFIANRSEEELRCPRIELNQLTSISDVTDQIRAATKDLGGESLKAALKAEMTKLESACAVSATVRCDVVELYRGGKYDLYRYRRYQDVRLVFAPEYGAGEFGGDPDNFSFPRFGFDVALYRVYEGGRPIDSHGNYFRWSNSGGVDGELTFVSGHPGRTSRLLTIDQLQFDRDTRLPFYLGYYAEERGLLTEFGKKGKEESLFAGPDLYYAENALKLIKGQLAAILTRNVMDKKEEAERELRRQVENNRVLREYIDAWPIVANAVERYRKVFLPYMFVEGLPQRQPLGFQSQLAAIARILVRASEELQKPDGRRLREYTEANLPALKQLLLSTAPIHQELEIEELSFTLGKLREELGADHSFVRQLFNGKSPAELARALVESSALANLEERKRLFGGGRDAIKASTDPMIAVMRDTIDPYARRVREDYEANVEAPFTKGGEKIARALFALRGSSVYPDATGTLRLSFGQIKGQANDIGAVGPFVTTIGGAFMRSTGREPFALPVSWLEAKDKLKLDLPLNVVTTNEAVGGNSGSPLLNKNAELIGLVFDSNLSGRGNAYVYQPEDRTVAVDSACILEILSKVYNANRIVKEIRVANGE